MIELIVEIIVIGFFSNIVGVNVRYYFYRIINEERTKDDIKNEPLVNAFIGIICFFLFFFACAMIFDVLNLL